MDSTSVFSLRVRHSTTKADVDRAWKRGRVHYKKLPLSVVQVSVKKMTAGGCPEDARLSLAAKVDRCKSLGRQRTLARERALDRAAKYGM